MTGATLTLLVIALVGISLRFHALARDERFHPDEALFSTFARSAALNGDWYLHGALDKPPLSIYATALTMTLFVDNTLTPGLPDISPRMGEFAARLPNTFASILTAAFMVGLARRLYHDRLTALLVLVLMALSPYAIAFSATGFTDGLMLLGMAAALWAIAAGRWSWSAVFLVLAFWSKPQAVFYLPLVVALGWAQTDKPRALVWGLVRLSAILYVGFVLLLMWETQRDYVTTFIGLASQNNDPWRLVRSGELLPRLQTWLGYGGLLLGAPLLTALLTVAAVFGVVWRIQHQPRVRAVVIDMILCGYALAYLALHWLVAFNTYDRYLLPVLPVLALLAARGVTLGVRGLYVARAGLKPAPTGITMVVAAVVVGGLMLPAAFEASHGRAAVGGDRGEHASIDHLAPYLNGKTLGAIVYDYWLGWELGYYLGQWTDKRRVYYPSPDALAEGALQQPDPAPRYVVAPADAPVGRWLDALERAGFAVSLDAAFEGYVIYRVMPP